MKRYTQPRRTLMDDAITLVIEANEAAQDEMRDLLPDVLPDLQPKKQQPEPQAPDMMQFLGGLQNGMG